MGNNWHPPRFSIRSEQRNAVREDFHGISCKVLARLKRQKASSMGETNAKKRMTTAKDTLLGGYPASAALTRVMVVRRLKANDTMHTIIDSTKAVELV